MFVILKLIRINPLKKMIFLDRISKYKFVILIGLLFFIIPFFWLKPGEMDLGGDSSRLFFYDPLNYLKYSNMYDVVREGRGLIEPEYSYDFGYIPYLAIFILLKFILFSPTTLINFFSGVKLAGGFIVIYLILREFLLEAYGDNKNDFINKSSILAGVFYTVSQGSVNLIYNWETALTTHNQFFIYPLIFLFLFKSLITHRYSYLWIALLISFIFSPNFGLESMPPFFAFWPLTTAFLFFYIKIFGKKPIPWKIIFAAIILFPGVHSYHLLVQVASLFDSGSFTNVRVFDKSSMIHDGLNYFVAILPKGMATLNFLLPSPNMNLKWISFLSTPIIIIGFILNKKKELLFISIFFFITFFLTTANITNIGVEAYKSLFYLPGFSMFRVFFVKWLYVFVFFYALLFGFALYNIIEKLKVSYSKFFIFFIFIFLIISGIPLFSGTPINKSLINGTNIKKSFVMDPKYEQTLEYIRILPDDGKILALPLTDFYFQFFFGKNGGAYLGLSTISHLTNKYSFTGEQHFGYTGKNPYNNLVKKYAKEKNYDRLNKIFSLMNIRYILFNNDSRIYKEGFSDSPYFLQEFFPKTQDGYEDFIGHFPIHQIYKNGSYVLYEFNNSDYNSTIFIPKGVYKSNNLLFDNNKLHSVFIDGDTCIRKEFREICKDYVASDSNVNFKMINPASYEVTITQKRPQDKILLVMQHTFHKGWKLVIDKKNISEKSHFLINGYANGWLLGENDIPHKEKFTVFIKLDPQKYFWYGWAITGASLIVIIGLFITSLIKKNENN